MRAMGFSGSERVFVKLGWVMGIEITCSRNFNNLSGGEWRNLVVFGGAGKCCWTADGLRAFPGQNYAPFGIAAA